MSRQKQWATFASEAESDLLETKDEQTEHRDAGTQAVFTVRLRLLMAGFACFLLLVVVRLVTWQVFGRDTTVSQAATFSDNSRGRILDSTHLLMATDIILWEIYASPRTYQETNPSPEKVAGYAAKIGIPVADLREALSREGQSALVERNVSQVQCKTANNKDETPYWIWCDFRRVRSYPQGPLGSHVLGFADAALTGQAGIERAYEQWLRTTGTWPAERLPGSPQPLPEDTRVYLPSPAGRDLILNLNAALQYRVETILAESLAETGAKSGSIIVLGAKDSAVLALANKPDYDPNTYAEADKAAWSNIAVSDHYEPGSVMKIITFAAALDAGVINLETPYEDSGELTISGQKITNSQNRASGLVTARQAFAMSLNVVSANICLDMGAGTFYRYLRQFGFGRPTEADLGLESPGIVKRPGTVYWSLYDQAANSFGQGISVTPLQMVNAVAAIANGGRLMQPQGVRNLVYNGEMYRVPPRLLGQAVKPETAHKMTQLMVYTVESYSAGPNLVPGYRVAGKTGTAEIPQEKGYTSDLSITSFVGFLPAADPKIVILVKLDEPRTSRWAEQVALPVFGKVAREAVQILRIAPDDRMP